MKKGAFTSSSNQRAGGGKGGGGHDAHHGKMPRAKKDGEIHPTHHANNKRHGLSSDPTGNYGKDYCDETGGCDKENSFEDIRGTYP